MNAPESLQLTADNIFSLFKCKSCFEDLDNVTIFTQSLENQLMQIKKVLTTLRMARFFLKLRKFNFFAKTYEQLGHIERSGKPMAEKKNLALMRRAS